MTDLLKYPDPSVLKSLAGNFASINQMLAKDCGSIPDPECQEKVQQAISQMEQAIGAWQTAIQTIDRLYQVEVDQLRNQVLQEVCGEDWLKAENIRTIALYRDRRGSND